MTKEGALNILRDKDITESSELQIAVKALIALELERHRDSFHVGQRIRHKHTGNLGVFGFHNGHPAVKWDGDSYFVGIMISEWEPV